MSTMIATCSVEKRNIDVSSWINVTCLWLVPFQTHLSRSTTPYLYFFQETISTCRFAQRVALVKNEALLNEELDPKLVSVLLG